MKILTNKRYNELIDYENKYMELIDIRITLINKLRQENKQQKEIINKAIEYLETLHNMYIGLGENQYNLTKMYASEKNFVKDLLEILGDSNE